MNSKKIIALTIAGLVFSINAHGSAEQLKIELEELNRSLHHLQGTLTTLSQKGLIPLEVKLKELSNPRSRSTSPQPQPKPKPPVGPKPRVAQPQSLQPFQKITRETLFSVGIDRISITRSSLHAAILENILNHQLIPYSQQYSQVEKDDLTNLINLYLNQQALESEGLVKTLVTRNSCIKTLNLFNKTFKNSQFTYKDDYVIPEWKEEITDYSTLNSLIDKINTDKKLLEIERETIEELIDSLEDTFAIYDGTGKYFDLKMLNEKTKNLTNFNRAIINLFNIEFAQNPLQETIISNATYVKNTVLKFYRRMSSSLTLFETIQRARVQPEEPAKKILDDISALKNNLEDIRTTIIAEHETLLKKLHKKITVEELAKNDLEEWNELIDIIKKNVTEIIKEIKDENSPMSPITQNCIQQCLNLFENPNKMNKCKTLTIKDRNLYAPLKFLEVLKDLADDKIRLRNEDNIIDLMNYLANLCKELKLKPELKDNVTISGIEARLMLRRPKKK